MIFGKRDFIQTSKTLPAPATKQIPNFFLAAPLEGTPYRNIYDMNKDFVWKSISLEAM